VISQCFSEGEFRLANVSNSPNPVNFSAVISGRVEVCYNGTYGSVCDSGWDETDARIFCNDLLTNVLQIPAEVLCKFLSLFGTVCVIILFLSLCSWS
jgi:hypothetical protein